MIVVADTSPINYLVLIGYEFVLPRLYGEVFIPYAVFMELNDRDTPEVVRNWMAEPPKWMGVEGPGALSPQIGSLDAGESAGILLAERLHADLILIDDAVARREAESRGLNVAGTLRVLQSAAHEGLLDLGEGLARLKKTNFYVAPKLIERLLRDAQSGGR
jgi:predicted nucleic acid-binding protein